jgi:hypothetical protein
VYPENNEPTPLPKTKPPKTKTLSHKIHLLFINAILVLEADF